MHAYRWWTIRAWRDQYDQGLKCGPVTVCRYQWDGRHWAVCVFNRWNLFDTGLRAHRQE